MVGSAESAADEVSAVYQMAVYLPMKDVGAPDVLKQGIVPLLELVEILLGAVDVGVSVEIKGSGHGVVVVRRRKRLISRWWLLQKGMLISRSRVRTGIVLQLPAAFMEMRLLIIIHRGCFVARSERVSHQVS